MFGVNWEEFWWTNITGPNIVVKKVARSLRNSANVILKVPFDLPWRQSMRSAIQSEFRNGDISHNIIIEIVDAVDDNPEHLEPGRLILERYADDIVKLGFRNKSGITIQEYIRQREILKNRIIWVKGLTDNSANHWMSFCRSFSPRTSEEGLFVLEINGSINCQETKKMHLVDYSQHVSNYDVQLLNVFILDNYNEHYLPNMWKRYISTVAAVLCDRDAEISARLLEIISTGCSIIDGLKQIAEMPEYHRRGSDDFSAHILHLYRNDKIVEIQRRIWSAQVQVLFPLIELERVKIVNRFYSQIQEALQSGNVYQYGKVITDPMEVELGTLSYTLIKKKEDFYTLYLPDERYRQRIRFLHECRNKLAHMDCCSHEQVISLLRNCQINEPGL